jgi:hypothetical protein
MVSKICHDVVYMDWVEDVNVQVFELVCCITPWAYQGGSVENHLLPLQPMCT